jgi:hypothetical protein
MHRSPGKPHVQSEQELGPGIHARLASSACMYFEMRSIYLLCTIHTQYGVVDRK